MGRIVAAIEQQLETVPEDSAPAEQRLQLALARRN
jgi:hypothetical protein